MNAGQPNVAFGPAPSVGEALSTRFSARAFTARPVDPLLLRRILSRAGRAPSGGNLQPWRLDVLGGERLAAFKTLIAARMQASPDGEGTTYDIYPRDLKDPYRSRRFKCGDDLFATLGMGREARGRRRAFVAGNFRFWNAPVGMFVSIDSAMGRPQWSDVGMYILAVMLLAREAGLHTCAQEAWAHWHSSVAEFLGWAPERQLFCGLALGYADEAHSVNTLRTERAPLDDIASFHGI